MKVCIISIRGWVWVDWNLTGLLGRVYSVERRSCSSEVGTFWLVLSSFEPFGGWNAWNGIFGASLGLPDIEFGLFKVSNTSKLCADGMGPWIYVLCVWYWGDTHARWRACRRAPCELWLGCSVVLCSYLILFLSMRFLRVRVIEFWSMLETMFRLYAYSVGTHWGHICCGVIFLNCSYILSHTHSFAYHISVSVAIYWYIISSYLVRFSWHCEPERQERLMTEWGREPVYEWYLRDRAVRRSSYYWFMP